MAKRDWMKTNPAARWMMIRWLKESEPENQGHSMMLAALWRLLIAIEDGRASIVYHPAPRTAEDEAHNEAVREHR